MRTHKRALSVVISAACLAFSVNSMAATWKLATGDAAGGTQYELAENFAQELDKRTDGKIKANIFSNSQLGSEQDTVNNASMGMLELSVVAINNITPFSPTAGILTLPYVIRSVEDAKLLTQGAVGKQLAEDTIRDAGVRILGWAYSGCRRLTNSARPIASPADLKGLVIRVPKNEIMIASYQAWGVNPNPMAWSETFTALQQGVVHGQDNPYMTIDAMKFYEVQKYITNSCYIFSLEPLIMGEGTFQGLSPELQTAVLEAGEAATNHSYDYLIASEENIKKRLVEQNGMTIVEPANDEKEWIAQAKTVWPKFYKSIGGKDKLDEVLQVLGREPAPEK